MNMARGPFEGIRRFLSLPSRTPARVARDVEDEVAFHLEMKAAELVAAGHSRAEADRLARQHFGNVDRERRALREGEASFERQQQRWGGWGEWGRDVRHTLRQAQRSPGFALLVIATLALGVGATTAIFSAVYAILLAPLPFAEPDRLVRVMRQTPGRVAQSSSGGDFLEFQRTSRTLTGLASYYVSTGNLASDGEPQRVVIARVSHNFLGVLGVVPAPGRSFTPAEDTYKAAEVAVLSHAAWQRLFGGDPKVVGRTFRMDRQEVQVVGVLPPGREYPETAELWLPMKPEPEMMSDENRGASWLRLVGRLAPGVTLAQANAEFEAMSRSITERFPVDRAETTSTLVPLADVLLGDVRQPLWVLLGAVAMVLLIACTNVAALLLGRVMARDGELALRTALGAGRGRLMRQLLTESVTLGLAGAVAGVGVAALLVRALVALAPDIPRLAGVTLNPVVLAFSAALGIVTGLLFGVVPAWHAGRHDLHGALRASARSVGGTRRAARVRGSLVVGQFALALVLLTGAGLLMRTFGNLRNVDPGFTTAQRTVFTVTLPQDGSFDGSYGGVEGQRNFLRNLMPKLENIAGVQRVGASLGMPLSPGNFVLGFEVDGRPKSQPGQEPEAQLRVATPGYFPAMGIPLRRGRTFGADDRAGAPIAIVVSEQLARQYFPGEDVVGRRLVFSWSRDSVDLAGEVVGVVGDTKQGTLEDDPPPLAYVAADQWPVDQYTFVLESSLPSGVLGREVVRVVHEVDPELPVYDLQPAEALMEGALSTARFYLLLMALFAALAMVLAALGIYGVMAYGVQQRRRELGIRMALGASLGGVQRLVVGEGLRLAAIGVALGVAGALSLGGVLREILHGVGPHDPLTLLAVVCILLVTAVAACVVPARHAAGIDPQRAVRED